MTKGPRWTALVIVRESAQIDTEALNGHSIAQQASFEALKILCDNDQKSGEGTHDPKDDDGHGEGKHEDGLDGHIQWTKNGDGHGEGTHSGGIMDVDEEAVCT